MAADAVRVVAVNPAAATDAVVLPRLTTLNLTGNPLNNRAYDFYLEQLQRLGTGLSYSANTAPVLQPMPLGTSVSRALQFDGVNLRDHPVRHERYRGSA